MIIRITSETGDYVEGKIEDESYESVILLVDGLMVAFGFHPDTVKDGRNNEREEKNRKNMWVVRRSLE